MQTMMILALSLSLAAQDDKTTQLRKEIADLKAQLALKETELAKISPAEEVEYLWPNDLKPGTAGPFGDRGVFSMVVQDFPAQVKAVKIVDANRMVVSVGVGKSVSQILVLGSTAGIADGKVFDSPWFKVLGTEKFDGKTYYTVEPYTPKPRAPKPVPVKKK